MKAGKLDRVITIQRFTSTVDDYGTPVETWTDVATVRAQLLQASTEEYIRAAGATDQAVVIFRTRWLDGVMNADRVSFDGSTYNIKETKEIGRRVGLELRCEALS
jgi:SPP1 family predicted phage head-tail adaptor